MYINKIFVFLIDVILYELSFYLAFIIRFGNEFPEKDTIDFLEMIPWFFLVFIIFSLIYNIYSEYKKIDDTLVSLICVILLTTAVNLALAFVLNHFAISRLHIVVSVVLQFILLGLWRYIVWKKALLIRQPKKAMIIGYPSEIKRLIQSINNSLARGMQIEKELRLNGKDNFNEQWSKIVLEKGTDNIEVIIICSSVRQDSRKKIIDYCIQSGTMVMIVPDFYDIVLQNARLVSAGDTPIIQLQGLLAAQSPMIFIKRAMDITLSFVAMIILFPLGLLIALSIKVSSPGPIFYKQVRMGLKGEKFKVYKFRTMVQDAEKMSGPVLAKERDPRITTVGRILRQTRLDEIPQFWNVFIGDMSLVGPRPERPFFVEQFSEDLPEFKYRHCVKGGITGLAQIEGNYSTEPDKKLTYDLLYAQNNNVLTDFILLFRTAKVLLQKGKAS